MDATKQQQLTDLLAEYFGELMYYKDQEKDWIEREKIIHKMNAVHVLMETGKHEKTFMQAVNEVIQRKDSSRCCGRCDGVHDACVADMVCMEHCIEGCEICFGKRG